MPRVFLVGYMGSGKSTVGAKLARKLRLPFFDLDKLVEAKANKTITQIFSDDGENSFRKIEMTVLLDLISDRTDFVLACGGGAPCFSDNMDVMNKNGITVYLELSAKTLSQRVANSKLSRPLISHLNSAEAVLEFISHHLAERESFYKKSKLIVDGLSIDANELAQLVSETM